MVRREIRILSRAGARERGAGWGIERIEGRTFRVPRLVHLPEKFHRVGAPAAQLAVPEQKPLGLDVPMDEAADCGPECLLLVRA